MRTEEGGGSSTCTSRAESEPRSSALSRLLATKSIVAALPAPSAARIGVFPGLQSHAARTSGTSITLGAVCCRHARVPRR